MPGQLGLERTPAEYVAAMVEVFREVRRVLREDGTLWLNMGDTYSRDPGKGGSGPNGKHDFIPDYGNARRMMSESKGSSDGRVGRADRAPVPVGGEGLKPKDLVGIPWRLAFALQQPYYTGTIREERDRVWLAAMLDAEGCLFIHRRKAGQHNGQGYYRQNDSFGPGVEISNTSVAIVERIAALVGKGSICSQGPNENARRKQTIYRWNLRTIECRDFVRELYPYLVAKKQQARILIGCPSSGEQARAAHGALIALHRTGLSDVDFPEPKPMMEPGYYLRSDIIWSKCNPMPESVRDRPTKAHEFIFLFSKAQTYYYDADAIREADSGQQHDRNVFDGQPSLEPSGGLRSPHRGIRAFGVAEANGLGRNRRSVWTVPTQPYPEAHFATFPEDLIRPCILAGAPKGGIVFDPFVGSGTTVRVAVEEGRRGIGMDLSAKYLELATRRTAGLTAPFPECA